MNTNAKILETLLKEVEYYGLNTNYIEKTRKLLLENIREDNNKTGRYKKPAAIIASMFKKTEDRFIFANTIKGGYAFLDGYRLFTMPESLGYEVVKHNEYNENNHKGYDCQSIIDAAKQANYKPLEIDVTDLKTFLKVCKPKKRGANDPYVFKTPDGYAAINPRYLMDLIEFSGDNTILYCKRNAPVMNKEQTALVLPVNINPRGGIYTDADYEIFRAKYFMEGVKAA